MPAALIALVAFGADLPRKAEVAKANYADAVEAARREYAEALETILREETMAGDLDGARAVQRELGTAKVSIADFRRMLIGTEWAYRDGDRTAGVRFTARSWMPAGSDSRPHGYTVVAPGVVQMRGRIESGANPVGVVVIRGTDFAWFRKPGQVWIGKRK